MQLFKETREVGACQAQEPEALEFELRVSTAVQASPSVARAMIARQQPLCNLLSTSTLIGLIHIL